jgi:hypothetical protein
MSSSTSFTYNTLIAELQRVLEEASAEYVADLPVLVSLGESRLTTDLNFEIFDRVVTGALTASVFVQPIKPATWQGTRSLHLRDVGGAGLRRFLERRTYEWCLDYEPDETLTAEPLYYAEFSETEFFMTPAPNATYAFELRQIQSPAALTVGNQTTWLGTNAGDILMYACLIASEEFLKSDQGEIQGWKTTYGELVQGRKLELRRQWRADYSPIKETARPVSLL